MNFEERYFNRQTLVFGEETQGKIRGLRVFISGLTLLGLQVAKNLVLMGVRQLLLFDSNTVGKVDAQHSLYFKPSQIGQPKAEASLLKLQQLSQFTEVLSTDSNEILRIVEEVDVAVLVDCWDENYATSLNHQMHQSGKGFISVSNLSLYGLIFVDFGENHQIIDRKGQRLERSHIKMITNDKQGKIQFADEDKTFEVDDEIYISHVKGMREVNGQIYRIVNQQNKSYGKWNQINASTELFSDYRSGGVAYLHRKKEKPISFKTLRQSLKESTLHKHSKQTLVFEPNVILCTQELIILKSFYEFNRLKSRLPFIQNQDQASQLKTIASNFLLSVELETIAQERLFKLLEMLSLIGQLQISPYATIWGGIAAQEVIKFTGKYAPIYQWMHHDEMQMVTLAQQRGRDKYSLIFGNQLCQSLQKAKVMLVGAGALGSEFLKMFCEMRVGCKEGSVIVVDDDNLNECNLNRMCLTTKSDLGQSKSDLLLKKSISINEDMNLQSIKEHICKSLTNSKISSSVWKQLDMIVTAVDTFTAKYYLDTLSSKYKKIMLACGSEDVKFSTQTILPFKTETFSSFVDMEGDSMSLPMKSHHLPYKMKVIAHFSVDYLAEILQINSHFYQLSINKSQFIDKICLEHKKKYGSYFNEKLSEILKKYEFYKRKSFTCCIELAIMQFYNYFYIKPQELLKNFPKDSVNSSTHQLFWSGLKSLPQIIQLNLEDPLHQEFIFSLSAIYASIFDVKVNEDCIELAKEIANKEFILKCQENKFMTLSIFPEKEQEIKKVNEENRIKLTQCEFNACVRISFDKRNPSPIHLKFLYTWSILTAKNYQLEEINRLEIERIACQIAPTVITGISLAAGFQTLELIKILKKSEQSCLNSYANFALPKIVQSQLKDDKLTKDSPFDPVMASPIKAIPQFHSSWEILHIVGPMTVRELKEHFERALKVRIEFISVGSRMILGFNARVNQLLENMQISAALTHQKMTNIEFPIVINIGGTIEEGEIQCFIPSINYYLPKLV